MNWLLVAIALGADAPNPALGAGSNGGDSVRAAVGADAGLSDNAAATLGDRQTGRGPWAKGSWVDAAPYAGDFAAAPVPHWRVRIPGPRMSSAAHTERGRPVVQGAYVFVGGAADAAVHVFHRRTGALIRSLPARASVESEPLIASEGPLAGRIWFSDTGGNVWCYDADGRQQWRYDARSPILVRPTLHGDTLFVANVDGVALALNAKTGEMRWRYQQKADLTRRGELSLYASPPPVIVDDLALFGFADGSIVAFDQDSGDVEWTRRVGAGAYPDVVAEPVVGEGLVFGAGYFEPFLAFDMDSRTSRWTIEAAGAGWAPATIPDADGALLAVPGTDGKLRAVVRSTGDERWTWDSGDDGALTSPVLTSAGLLIASTTGTVHLLNPATGQERWKYHPSYVLEGVGASPAVAGRQMFIVTNGGFLESLVSPKPETLWGGDEMRAPLWSDRRTAF